MADFDTYCSLLSRLPIYDQTRTKSQLLAKKTVNLILLQNLLFKSKE